MKYAFHGAFAPYIYGLIEKKRSLGYDYYESERILRTFDEFCREQFPCETHLTAKIVMRWAEQTGTEQNLFRLNKGIRDPRTCQAHEQRRLSSLYPAA